MSGNNNRRNNENQGSGWGTAAVVGGVLGGLAAVAGGLYYLTRDSNQGERPEQQAQSTRRSAPPNTRENGGSNMSDYLSSLVQRMNTGAPSYQGEGRRGVPRTSIPANPSLSNLNDLVSDIYLRYIALNDEDFEEYYTVVDSVFRQIHEKMKEVDPYYQQYSSTVQFAGSHPDRLRINKPDEFDIDIVIGLPLNYKYNGNNPADNDFILEPKDPGFIQLKMGVQYQRLPMRDGCNWHINKTAYEWKDDKNYLLRSNFSNWFKSVVNRALNQFELNGTSPPIFYVEGVPYTVKKSESGPAMTIYIENQRKKFKLDVDLVPAIRFPIDRWPICSGYMNVPPEAASKDYFMVVPKPNKSGLTPHDQNRSWRIAMHEQERMLMHDTNHLRQAIRLIKKLRDSQGMDKIASYYIKTLFFWEVLERKNDPTFWNNAPAYLFKIMVKKFHDALVAQRIPYLWNKSSNLIGSVNPGTLAGYAAKTGKLLNVLEEPSNYKEVARFLLTPAEFREYNERFLHI